MLTVTETNFERACVQNKRLDFFVCVSNSNFTNSHESENAYTKNFGNLPVHVFESHGPKTYVRSN